MASIQRTVDKSDRVPEFFDLDSMEVDGQNLIFHLNRANANMAGSLADPLFLIVDTNVDDSTFAMEGPICTGPYKVESFSPTDSCVVTKNENYWDGEVPLDKVTLKCVDDQTTRSMALQTGEIDIAYNLKTENLIEFEGNDNYEIQELQSLRSTYAFMNQSEGRALSDKALRQALLRGLDKQTYCDVLLEGGATAGKAPVPPTLDFGFDDLNDENSYDPEGAKKLLDDAGIVDTDGDGIREYNGKNLSYKAECPTGWSDWNATLEIVAAAGKNIGINIETYFPEAANYSTDYSTGNFEITMQSGPGTSVANPYMRCRFFMSSDYNDLEVNFSGNFGHYQNDRVDEILAAIPHETDDAKLKDYYTELSKIMLEDCPCVPLMYRPQVFHEVNESVWTNYPQKDDGTNVPPMDCTDGYGVAALYNLELIDG